MKTLAILLLICSLNAQAEKNMATDVCNLGFIYQENGFNYSLPRNNLEGFLSGKAFDNLDVYSKDEAEKLNRDINSLYQRIMAGSPSKEKIAVMTAGAPGAGKTTLMKQDLEKNGNRFAYIDPDDVALKSMTETYLEDIKNGATGKAAYNKWRPGSNAANHLILANLIRQQYGFYFGTTSTSPVTHKFFEFLKQQGYHIKLIHIVAPDDVRWGSIQERDKTFVQTTEQDVKEKGLLLPQRINDTYLKYADEIDFYYRGGVSENAVLAARWNPKTLEVVNQEAYGKIKAIHNSAVDQLKRSDLHWEKSVEAGL